MKIAASTVREILKEGRNRPGVAPIRACLAAVPAIPGRSDPGVRLLHRRPARRHQAHVLAVIEHATRRIRILGVTLHPAGGWTAQQARNLITDLGEQAHRVKFMIRDRGSNYTAAFDAVLAGAGIRTVLCNVRTSRMNATAERWIGGCRRELLDLTLIWNQSHLRRILHQYETRHNQHRPHRSLDSAAPLKPLPQPVVLGQYRVRRQTRAGGTINEYRLVARCG
jgi:putative transposase